MRNILSMLASGFAIGAALILAATVSPVGGDVESAGSCPAGQSLQGDATTEGYEWFYCEPGESTGQVAECAVGELHSDADDEGYVYYTCAPWVDECESEDSAGPCYWDAATRGNGLGESFMVNADQTVTYQN